MPTPIRRANGRKSAVRSRIEHVFAEQKDRMGLFIRTIGIARARIKIGLANLVYNMATSGSTVVRDYGTPGADNPPCP